jgi:RNA polymerase sigma-70 factor, ECF subfamily
VGKKLKCEEASDQELLTLFTRGSDEAFLALYHRHQGPLFRFALHMSGKRELAEEVTQEVFMNLVTAPSHYDAARGCFQAYLIGSARNHVRRKLKSENGLVAIDPAKESNGVGSDQAELLALRKALLSLRSNYREVIVLCDLEGFSYEEAAQQLECAVGTVRSRLHRARALLLCKLQGRPEKCLT